jgi:hypothetical protein
MATELVTHPSSKLFRACAVVDIRVSRYKCAIHQMVEVCERDSSATHLASPISPSMIGITDVVTCFSFTASASACTNFSYAPSKNLDGEREGRGCDSRRLICFQLFGFADTRPRPSPSSSFWKLASPLAFVCPAFVVNQRDCLVPPPIFDFQVAAKVRKAPTVAGQPRRSSKSEARARVSY